MGWSPSDMEALVGTTRAGFRIARLLGAGGMGAVYQADSGARGWGMVALKVLSPAMAHDERLRHRFLREARAQHGLAHPNVVPVFDAGEADGLAWIAMEFCESGSLAALMKQAGGALPEDQARGVFADILRGLSHAHTSGFVHRDIKPDNVLFRPQAQGGRAALADFGIVGVLGGSEAGTAQLTRTGSLLGTPAYMSPEACDGRPVDQRSDLYSLGCVMYQVLTGRIPFPADSMSRMLVAHVSERPTPSSQLVTISEDLDAIVLRLLEKKAKDRFPTADEVLRVLTGPGGYLADSMHGARNARAYQAALGATLGDAVPATRVHTLADRPPPRPATRTAAPRRRAAPPDARGLQGPVAGVPAVAARRPLPLWLVATAGLLAVAAVTFGVLWQAAAGERAAAAQAAESSGQALAQVRAGLDAARGDLAAARRELAAARAEAERLSQLGGQLAAAQADAVALEVLTAWRDTLNGREMSLYLTAPPARLREMDATLARVPPDLETARHLMARAMLRTLGPVQDMDRMLVDATRAAELEPDNREARMVLGDACFARGEYPDARREYDRLARNEPGDVRIHTRLAKTRQYMEGYTEALESFQRAMELAPWDYRILAAMARLRIDVWHVRLRSREAPGDLVELAGNDLDRAIGMAPREPELYEARGIWHQLNRRFDEAIADFQRALDITPGRASTWYHRGMTLHYAGRDRDAIESMSRAIELMPEYFHAYTNRGVFRADTGDPDGAIADYRAALDLRPRDNDAWAVWLRLGLLLAGKDQRDDAAAAFERAGNMCPVEMRDTVKQARARALGE